MVKKRSTREDKKRGQEVKEPLTTYVKRSIHVFENFDEMEAFEIDVRAKLSHTQLIEKLEQLRRMVYSDYLLSDGTWPKLERTISIQKPNT